MWELERGGLDAGQVEESHEQQHLTRTNDKEDLHEATHIAMTRAEPYCPGSWHGACRSLLHASTLPAPLAKAMGLDPSRRSPAKSQHHTCRMAGYSKATAQLYMFPPGETENT